ncbi:peptide synthetase [Streptomyces sp. NPDC054796]
MTPTCHDTTVRPLGAFERTIDFYVQRNPVQFSLVAELDHPVPATDLASALAKLRDRHPLLAVAVDRTAPEAAFRVCDGPVPLEVAAEGTPWQSVVAAEQTRPIPSAPGPLLRAVLVPGEPGCAVVLTFAHQIADGVGGLRALLDLVAALGGAELAPGHVPEPQEDLLARLGATPDDGDTPTGTPPEEDDPRMSTAGALVPFSGRTPHMDTLALDQGLTTRLRRRCRLERASVHAALCAAATEVFRRRGRTFVRVLSPMDLRRAAALPDEVVVRFAGARTASDAQAGNGTCDDGAGAGATGHEGRDGHDRHGFWALARQAHASLARQRTPSALTTGSAALAAHPPSSPQDAEAMMTAATAADIQITNLGAVDPSQRNLGALSALWGPAQITQLRGEHILGVVTVGGRLRMTELTHDPVAGLVPEMGAVLAAACADTGTGTGTGIR